VKPWKGCNELPLHQGVWPVFALGWLKIPRNLGGGISIIVDVHPKNWGKWIQIDDVIFFQMGLKPPTRSVKGRFLLQKCEGGNS